MIILYYELKTFVLLGFPNTLLGALKHNFKIRKVVLAPGQLVHI